MKESPFQTIELHERAQPKPDFGTPCNGCGICCAVEPCPVAYLFLFQRKGRCRALLWQDECNRYICGMVVQPDRYSFWIPRVTRRWVGNFIATRIAAGKGCDSRIETD